jgi:hypothetical protein
MHQTHKEGSYTFIAIAFFALLFTVVSLYFIGSPYSSFFNADGAVQVIMAHRFSFEHDFYFWGQNRLGSLLPLLTSPMVWAGLKPLYATILMNYLFLIGSGLTASKFVSSPLLKIFILSIFLIPCHSNFFMVQLSQPYSLQIFLLLIPLLFFYHDIQKDERFTPLKMVFSGICFAAAVYVHDASIIYVALYFAMMWQFNMIGFLRNNVLETCSLLVPFGLLLGYVLYRKLGTPDFSGYSDQSINHWSVFLESFFSWTQIFNHSPIGIIKSWGILESLVLICLTASALVLSAISIKKHGINKGNVIPVFLMLNAIIFYTAVCFSGWYVQNYSDGRYMIFPVCMMLLATTIFLGQKKNFIPTIRYVGVGLLVVLFATSVASTLRPKHTDGLQLTFSQRTEIEKIRGTGIIGNYWFSYPFSAYNPASIASTPHDKDFARSHIMVEKVLLKDSIYLVKNGWLEEFKDTIPQFGVTLIRVKPYKTIQIGNAHLSLYQKSI